MDGMSQLTEMNLINRRYKSRADMEDLRQIAEAIVDK
jgi:hypothetical protein